MAFLSLYRGAFAARVFLRSFCCALLLNLAKKKPTFSGDQGECSLARSLSRLPEISPFQQDQSAFHPARFPAAFPAFGTNACSPFCCQSAFCAAFFRSRSNPAKIGASFLLRSSCHALPTAGRISGNLAAFHPARFPAAFPALATSARSRFCSQCTFAARYPPAFLPFSAADIQAARAGRSCQNFTSSQERTRLPCGFLPCLYVCACAAFYQ